MKILKASHKSVKVALSILNAGGVIICPTDTVYGFLADATNKKAVEKIYKIKKRPKSKPLPMFVKNISMAKKIAVVDGRAQKFFSRPKTTVVLKRVPNTKLYGQKEDSLAMRIPHNAFLQKILIKPLVQTSVNISGQQPLSKVADIVAEFWGNRNVDLIIDGGDVKNAKPSKIIDATNRQVKTLRK